MPNLSKLKSQRDRFLAFAFAASDLLIEINENDEIIFVLGASKSISGIESQELQGLRWLDIFAKAKRAKLMSLKKIARDGKRTPPLHVKMNDDIIKDQNTIVSGIKMPGSQSFYLSLSFVNDVMERIADASLRLQEERLDKDDFAKSANTAIEKAREKGQDLDITLFDLGKETDTIKSKLGEEQWHEFSDSIIDILETFSVDGKTASQITDGRYSLLHDESVTSDSIQEQISELSKEAHLDENDLQISSKTVDTNTGSLSEKEASRAIFYTLSEFEKRGSDINIETLQSGFKSFLSDNAQKIQEFKNIINSVSFNMHFQPIVNLQDNTLKHFEMLARFADGGNTQEWILFGEDIGMAAEFDLAVLETALNHIHYKAAHNNMSFAINISGQSIQNENFFKNLIEKIDDKDNLSKRLIFEITESNTIKNLDLVNGYISELQSRGFKVCLDDFGAGSASFQYLHNLHVDYLKIDGVYTQRILESKRDFAMIKNLVQMCKDLNIKTVAERIEDENEARALVDIGVDYGQGYYFGKPNRLTEYAPPK